MKIFLAFSALIAVTFTSYSQFSNYNDIGLLMTRDDYYGTARFNAMSGAFGALGSDISSIKINPAGGAISKDSKASVSLGVRSVNANANYYNTTTNSQNEYFNIPQAGFSFVFDSHYKNSNWNRFALTFNYSLKSDFNADLVSTGNGDFINFTSNPNEINDNPYNAGVSQTYNRATSRQSSEFNFGFSAVHDNKLFAGASLNIHNFDYTEISSLNEINEDINGNVLDALNTYESYFQGTGFSLGFGIIYKFNQNLRLGLAYETPTWYQEVLEDSNIFNQDSNNEFNTGVPGFIDIITTDPDGNNEITYTTDNFLEGFIYRVRTAGKLTASGAYVFGKKGLISIDYIYRDYTNIQFSDGDFLDVNNAFETSYRASHRINIGTEWRFNKLSVRGGYHYEKNPNLLLGGNTNKDNIRGFSTGLGYNFGNLNFDLSYQRSENTDFYQLYELNDLNVENTISRITGTLTFNL